MNKRRTILRGPHGQGDQYRFLFEQSPVSLWVEDLSAVKAIVDALRRQGVRNFKEYFHNNPRETAAAVRLARVIDVNQATLDLFGATTKEELLAHLDQLLIPNASPMHRFTPNVLCLALGESHCKGEFLAQTIQGKRLYLSYIWNVGDGDISSYSRVLYSIFDITSRKLAEEEFAQLAEQLRHVQKMEAIGVLAGGLVHDFNNILTSIMGNAEVLKSRLPPGSEQAVLVRNIAEAAGNSTNLIHQLLTLGRREDMQHIAVDVHQLIRNVRNLLSHSFGMKIQIQLRFTSTASHVKTAPTLLEAALLNLALNARDAMPDGGSLTFETRSITIPQAPAAGNVAGLTPGQYIEISVADTGTGMSPEVQRRIFEPFFTTKPRGVGTGLGLACVSDFVKSCRGSTRVETELGKGTTFTLVLPTAPADSDQSPAVQSGVLDATGQAQHIEVISTSN